jgi:asparagine synthase (glutamine-hydrolysing)
MCGICGYLTADQPQTTEHLDRALLERMNQTIFHRGPDSAGVYQQGGVGLAMRRLAIIDVAGGQQQGNQIHR